MRLRLALLAALAAAAAACPAALAAAGPPRIRAPEAIVIDARGGTVLYAKHPDGRREIASTTKLMTARLVLASTRPQQVFTAPAYSAQPAESTLGLAPGERMTVHDLMRALLLLSANDAAATLAKGVAGSEDAFVARMNQEASRLGLTGTHYANPVGLDDPGNYSTARDLALLARKLLRDPAFAAIVDLPRARLTSGAHPRTVQNRNTLVRTVPYVDGVKTGHTREAGYVLVGAARRGASQAISVVMGEPSEAARDSESLALLRYGLSQLRTVRPVTTRQVLGLLPVNYFSGLHIRARAARDVTLSVRPGAVVATRVELPLPLHLTGPLPTGTRVGRVVVTVNGRRAAAVPLVTAEPVPKAGFWRKWAARIGKNVTALVLALAAIVLLVALRLRGPLRSRRRGRVGSR